MAKVKQTRQPKSQPAQAAEPTTADFDGLPEALRRLAENPRVTVRRPGAPDPKGKCVVYWMQRSQRGIDSHGLDIAVDVANELGLPLVAYFAGISNFPHANLRHYAFLNQGLPDIEDDLAARNITFIMRRAPHESHERLLADAQAAMVLGDENPMREPERWRRELAERIRIPFWTVDTEVIVPSKLFDKAQYAAYTMRPKLFKLVPEYLQPFRNPHAEHAWYRPKGFLADDVRADITAGWKDLDRTVKPIALWKGGAHAAAERLRLFTDKLLGTYEEERNKPEMDGTSALSPYLHYGHICSQTIALAVNAAVAKHPELGSPRDKFFDELITWRELCVNFVRYQPHYDSTECAENWARTTIAEHDGDRREHVYTVEQLERAETYDPLWNAAQTQMVRFGFMHNFMRMYWAKKILEWTPDVESAMKACLYLNDRYFLDGRDPAGYAGIAWAILGKFDRPWGTRPIFGKRRYMSGASTGKKFNSAEYIRKMNALPVP